MNVYLQIVGKNNISNLYEVRFYLAINLGQCTKKLIKNKINIQR